MARYKDPVVARVRKIRRKLSARMIKARREGRLMEELRAIEREGERAYRRAVDGAKRS